MDLSSSYEILHVYTCSSIVLFITVSPVIGTCRLHVIAFDDNGYIFIPNCFQMLCKVYSSLRKSSSESKMAVFWVVVPCSPVEVYHRFREAITLMMETARTNETLVNFCQTTRRYNQEDSHLRTHRRENLKSYCLQCHLHTIMNYVLCHHLFLFNFSISGSSK
jgi:hypothetical protein